jgi:nicotinic acid mononucleotide adenylyltransferase
MQPVAISSTDIRRRINRGEAVDGLLPDRVAAYIEGERLYK